MPAQNSPLDALITFSIYNKSTLLPAIITPTHMAKHCIQVFISVIAYRCVQWLICWEVLDLYI